jgi:hypothetical protein
MRMKKMAFLWKARRFFRKNEFSRAVPDGTVAGTGVGNTRKKTSSPFSQREGGS